MVLGSCWKELPGIDQTVRFEDTVLELPSLPKTSDTNCKELGSNYKIRGRVQKRLLSLLTPTAYLEGSQNHLQVWQFTRRDSKTRWKYSAATSCYRGYRLKAYKGRDAEGRVWGEGVPNMKPPLSPPVETECPVVSVRPCAEFWYAVFPEGFIAKTWWINFQPGWIWSLSWLIPCGLKGPWSKSHDWSSRHGQLPTLRLLGVALWSGVTSPHSPQR